MDGPKKVQLWRTFVAYLVEQLQQGIKMAVVSDAGTLGISDPGFLLVREAQKANIKICALPRLPLSFRL